MRTTVCVQVANALGSLGQIFSGTLSTLRAVQQDRDRWRSSLDAERPGAKGYRHTLNSGSTLQPRAL